MNLIPYISTDQGYLCICDNCGSPWGHPETAYCFDCDTDAWSTSNVPIEEYEAAPEGAAENAKLSKTERLKLFRQFKRGRVGKFFVYRD